MKLNTFAIVLATLGFSGAALAGQVGAGPGGTGSLIVGSTVSPDSESRASTASPQPGKAGKVILTSDQTTSLAAYLQSQPGTIVAGSIITAPTTFADGDTGTITLNTATGELTLTRV